MNSEGIDVYAGRNSAKQKIKAIIARIYERRRLNIREAPSKKPFSVGRVEREMSDYANANNITLATPNLYISDERIAHAIRETKQRDGVAVSDEDMANFPSSRYRMKLYYDSKHKNFVYQDGRNKFIVEPNYEIKDKSGRTRHVLMLTASLITDINEFNMRKYIKIK